MPVVAICTEKVVIPALGAGISFKDGRLDYPPEKFVQHVYGSFADTLQAACDDYCCS